LALLTTAIDDGNIANMPAELITRFKDVTPAGD